MKTKAQKAKYNEYRRAWRRANPEKCRAQEKRWRDKHRAKYRKRIRAYAKQYYVQTRARRLAKAARLRALNPDYMRDFHLRRHYGLSLADHTRLAAIQGNVCAVCRQGETVVLRGRRILLSVDHDHRTGRIRGLLCSACNFALGKLRDDPAIARALADYLERHLLERVV